MSTAPPADWILVGSVYVAPDDPRLRSHAGRPYLAPDADSGPERRGSMIVRCRPCATVRHHLCERKINGTSSECRCLQCWRHEIVQAARDALQGGYADCLAESVCDLLALVEQRAQADRRRWADVPRPAGLCGCGCGREVMQSPLGRIRVYATDRCRMAAKQRRYRARRAAGTTGPVPAMLQQYTGPRPYSGLRADS